MKINVLIYPDEKKCASCRYDKVKLFKFENQKDEEAICATCFIEDIVDSEMEVEP
jgi:hypothetical protein